MSQALRKRLSVFALVASLFTVSVAVVSPAQATPVDGGGATANNLINDLSGDLLEVEAVQWLLDQIALTQYELSPWLKSFVNSIIKLSLPVICPVMGQAAAEPYQDAIETICLRFGDNPDPWQAIVNFTPWLCGFGGIIFPDYWNVIKLACGALQ
jgi:hypothetical protein